VPHEATDAHLHRTPDSDSPEFNTLLSHVLIPAFSDNEVFHWEKEVFIGTCFLANPEARCKEERLPHGMGNAP
jgi:hypothetical protein